MVRAFFALVLGLVLLMGQALAAVNVNTASQKELESLPGIGPTKALAIIDYRDANGPFRSLAQLDAVPGIGPSTLENIAPLVSFDGTTAAAPAANSSSGSSSASSSSASSGAKVNINSASQKQLESLPGIGPSKAAAIIGDRDANGPFSSCDALTRVTGIGRATVDSLRASCTAE